MAYFVKRYHPPGTPPGTIVESAAEKLTPLTLRLLDYTESEFTEKEIATALECRDFLQKPSITWIHVQGTADPVTMKELGAVFGLHSLALEDVINSGQRPKIDSFGDQLFVVTSLPVLQDQRISVDQVSFFLGPDYVISFHESEADPFTPIRNRLRQGTGKIRGKSTDYLLYSLIDIVVDRAFPVLESLGEQIEELEEELLDAPTKDTLNTIHFIKRELLLLRRMLWPQREVLSRLTRDECQLIKDSTKPYISDCYDHTIQIIDFLESYRETTASMLDVYLSSVSHRLNETMRKLTIIATIFMPLTFLVGVYGMNFGNNEASPWAMPELRWYYGYPLLWLLIFVVSAAMWLFFLRKKWW